MLASSGASNGVARPAGSQMQQLRELLQVAAAGGERRGWEKDS